MKEDENNVKTECMLCLKKFKYNLEDYKTIGEKVTCGVPHMCLECTKKAKEQYSKNSKSKESLLLRCQRLGIMGIM